MTNTTNTPANPDSATVGRSETIRIVGILILVQAVGAMANFWLPAIAPEVAGKLGVDSALIGYQVTTLYVLAMLSSLMASGLVGRFGAWRASQIALLLFAVAHLLFMAGTLGAIFIGSVTLGIGYGLITPPASHLLNRIATPQNRNFLFSIRFIGTPLGGIGAGIIAPAAALTFGWRESMAVTIIASLLLAAVMQPMRARRDDDRSRAARWFGNPVSDFAIVWRRPALRWMALTGLCMGAVQITLTTYIVTLLVEDVGYALLAAGLGLSLIQLAGVFGRTVWGWLADRIASGHKVLLGVGALTVTCCIATVFLSPDWPRPLVYGLCVLSGFVSMGWNGVYASEVARLAPPGQVGAATGASMFITFSGVFLGPAVFVAVHKMTGTYTDAYVVTALIGLGAIACVAASARRVGHDRAAT